MPRCSGSQLAPYSSTLYRYVRCHDGLVALRTIQVWFQCSFLHCVYPLQHMDGTDMSTSHQSRASLVTTEETTPIRLLLLSDTRFFPVILFSAIQASKLGASLKFILPLLSSLLVQWSLTMTSLNFCSVYPLWFLNSNSMCSALDYCCKEYNPKGQAGVILKTLFYVAVQSMTFRTFTQAQGPSILFLRATEDTGVTQMSFCHKTPFREKMERLDQVIFSRSLPRWAVLWPCSVPVLGAPVAGDAVGFQGLSARWHPVTDACETVLGLPGTFPLREAGDSYAWLGEGVAELNKVCFGFVFVSLLSDRTKSCESKTTLV